MLLPPLLLLQDGAHEAVVHAAMHALHRIFARLIDTDTLRPSHQLRANRNRSGKTAAGAAAAVNGGSSNGNGGSSSSTAAPSPGQQYADWLHVQYDDLLRMLLRLPGHPEPGLQVPAMRVLMDLLAAEALQNERLYRARLGDHTQERRPQQPKSSPGTACPAGAARSGFPTHLFRRICGALVLNRHFNAHLCDAFRKHYLHRYDDVRFYTLRMLARIIESQLCAARPAERRGTVRSRVLPLDDLARNIVALLHNLNMVTRVEEIDTFLCPVLEDACEAAAGASDDAAGRMSLKNPLRSLAHHRRVFSDCWFALLRLPMPPDTYKRVLSSLHVHVIPHLNKPRQLLDFLIDSCNIGAW